MLKVAQQLEAQLDTELAKLDNLEDDDLEKIRQQRIKDLKQQQEKTREWIAKGHGEYTLLLDEKEFFKAMKGEDRMICHFFRDNWPCKVGSCSWNAAAELELPAASVASAPWELESRRPPSTWSVWLTGPDGRCRLWTSTCAPLRRSTWRQGSHG